MKHLRLGWLLLVVFTVAGLILEALHGFKVAWYLDVGNETRHTMLRLGHAHGTFLCFRHQFSSGIFSDARPALAPRRYHPPERPQLPQDTRILA